jgi:dTDP-4-amino-4,6-dideoxygalactose transaminase
MSLAWPYYEEDEIAAVINTLKSGKVNYWTGEDCRNFEAQFASYHHLPYAISLANGTLALELALEALNIGPGDEVITTCRTFLASASAIVTQGATPILADIDPFSQNVTAATLKAMLTPKTKAIIVVHLNGWPCDMDEIMAFAKEHHLYVIEDCAQALGAQYKGKLIGTLGDIGAFSFCQDKIISTGGEGGMLITKDKALWEKAWAYKDHGKSYDTVFNKQHPPGFRWLHESFGTNFRMTGMQAAIGQQQLKKLNQWLNIRIEQALELNHELKKLPGLIVPEAPSHMKHVYYRYNILLNNAHLKAPWDRDRIIEALQAEGISCFVGSCPEIYKEQAFKKNKLGPKDFLPNAHWLADKNIALHWNHRLNKESLEKIKKAFIKIMTEATNL